MVQALPSRALLRGQVRLGWGTLSGGVRGYLGAGGDLHWLKLAHEFLRYSDQGCHVDMLALERRSIGSGGDVRWESVDF